MFSPLNPAECVGRLRAAGMGKFLVTPMEYKIEGSYLFLRKNRFQFNKTIWYQNRWQAYAWGALRPSGSGTELDISIGLPRYMLTMMAIELGIWAAVAAGLAWLLGPMNLLRVIEVPVIAIAFAAVPVYVLGTLFLGRRIARNEPAFLHDFLADTLMAEDQKVPTYPPPQASEENRPSSYSR